MSEMAKRDLLPAAMRYVKSISDTILSVRTAIPGADCCAESKLAETMSRSIAAIYEASNKLESDLSVQKQPAELPELSRYLRDVILPDMEALRQIVDKMEEIMPAEFYPYPSYGDLLFSVI